MLFGLKSGLVLGQMGTNLDRIIPFQKNWSLSAQLHTTGFGVNYKYSWRWKETKWTFLEGKLQTLGSPKEVSLTNKSKSESTPYVFGKMNAFGTLTATYGVRFIISEKITPQSVQINIELGGGPTIGIIKPVYYEINYGPADNNGQPKYQKFNPNDEAQQEAIIGKAPFPKGYSESSFNLGANLKGAISVEFGQSPNHYWLIEAGAMINTFPKEVPIFAFIKNPNIFFNPFISIGYGLRKE
jgi:hypothetical protein